MIGFVILAHADLHRTAAVARSLATQGAAVVIHVDANTADDKVDRLRATLDGVEGVAFCKRHACEWGRFSLIDATLSGIEHLFERWPEVAHVTLISGSCLPIRPLADLEKLLGRFPETDFIEAVDLGRHHWVKGGLADERFTLYFPFSWKRQRRRFDRFVEWQRKRGIRRRMPGRLRPHLGSQWWTLSRRTLDAILADPELARIKRFFRLVWIPDESFFQCLARKHGKRIISRPLTSVAFDFDGKPWVYHNDHVDALLNAKGYFTRKIWPGADTLYQTFLSPDLADKRRGRNGREIARLTRRAHKIRTVGRRGLIAQHKYPDRRAQPALWTARPVYVFDGFDRMFPDFVSTAQASGGLEMHGYLFGPERAEFLGGRATHGGNLTTNAAQRDYAPDQFLANLIWTRRRRLQGFMHDFTRAAPINDQLRRDSYAQIFLLDDAWLIDLFHHGQGDAAREAMLFMLYKLQADRRGWQLFQWDAASNKVVVRLADLILEPEWTARTLQARMPPDMDIRALFYRNLTLPAGFDAFLDRLVAAGFEVSDIRRLRRCIALAAAEAEVLAEPARADRAAAAI